MESESLLERLPLFLRNNLVALGLGFFGLLLLSYGLIAVFWPKQEKPDIVFEQSSTDSLDGKQANDKSVKSAQDKSDIVIDIAGAVEKPGVYHLDSDSRVQDAIKAAGGIVKTANNEWISKNLNLAAKLTDAAKMYVPFVGEQGQIQANQGTLGNIGDSGGGLININSASESQLDTLSGVGPVTAQKIIASRPYLSIEELLNKKIVGQSTFVKIRDKITVQ